MEEKIYHLGIKALIRNQRGKVLLLEVNQEMFKNPKPRGYWDIPGGRVLNGQTVEETLLREIAEETGITVLDSVEPWDTLISNIEIPLKGDEKVGLILSIYNCVVDDSVNIQLSEEHTDYSWVLPQEASQKLSYKYPLSFTQKVKELNLHTSKERTLHD